MPWTDGPLPTRWLGHPLWHLDTVDSTNQWLRSAMESGRAGHGAVVVADRQTAGRGRRGRVWESPPAGNIYTSALLCPPPERLSGLLSLLAGLAVVQAVRDVTQLDAQLKWPNDAVLRGRKFAGVLVEAGVSPAPWAIVGMGINVNGAPSAHYPQATSLAHEWEGGTVDAKTLFYALLAALEATYEEWLSAGDSLVVERWSRMNVTVGRVVEVHQPGQPPWVGRALRLDADGSLWVARDNQPIKIVAGDVSVRLPGGGYASGSC